jgi:hypothetical protein
MTRATYFLGLFFLATLAFGQPRVGVERQIAPAPFGLGFSEQTIAGLAFHDGRGFVIWNDSRSYPRATVLGSRIDERGELLDPHGIRLAEDPQQFSLGQAVVWLDGAWTVIWKTQSAILGRRIANDGSALTPPIVLFTPRDPFVGAVSVASNGRNLLFVHSFILNDGVFLASSDLATVTRVANPAGGPLAVSSDGDGYLLHAYPAGIPRPEGSSFVRLSGAGAAMASRHEMALPARIVWTGRDYLLFRHVHGGQLIARRISPTLDAAGEPFPVSPAGHKVWSINAASSPLDGSATVAWVDAPGVQTGGSVFVSTVAADNAVSGAREILPAPYSSATLQIAHDADHAIVAWTITTPPDGVLRIEKLDDVTIATAATARRRVAAHGRQTRLVASRSGNAEWLIYEQTRSNGVPEVRLTGSGTPPRAVFADEGAQVTPAIAAGSSGALAVWLQSGKTESWLVAMPLGPDGTPLLSEPSRIWESASPLHPLLYRADDEDRTPWYTRPAVLWTGSHYLVAFRFGTSPTAIRLARVLQDGSVLDPGGREGFALRRSGEQFMPVLTRVGSVALLAWAEGSNAYPCMMICGDPVFVRAGRVSLDGQPIDPDGLDVGTLDISHSPDIAANGDTALLTWLWNGRLAGRFINEHGVLGPTVEFPRQIALTLSVAAHSDSFLVAYRESRTDSAPSAITGRIVNRAGQVSAPFAIVNGADGAVETMAWTKPGGRAAVGYRGTAAKTGYTPRLFFREIDPEIRRRAIRQ